MLDWINMRPLIIPEIKEGYNEGTQRIVCTYEGCGTDDGWPT